MRVHSNSTRLAGAALTLAASAAIAAPAAAQYAYAAPVYDPYAPNYVGEVVVTGPHRTYGEGPSRLSQVVSIRDLDLATADGRDVLKWRIRDTARHLCRLLGEDNSASSALTPSCVDKAIRDTRPQVRLAVNPAYQRNYSAALTAQNPNAPIPY